MNVSASPLPVPLRQPGELDALLAAISDAIEALVLWDITAFQSAVDRQSELCARIAASTDWSRDPAAPAAARKVQDLNRVYDRLLQHSVHWTRTIRVILQAGGQQLPSRASVHFRG
jgi:hypothetical protein